MIEFCILNAEFLKNFENLPNFLQGSLIAKISDCDNFRYLIISQLRHLISNILPSFEVLINNG